MVDLGFFAKNVEETDEREGKRLHTRVDARRMEVSSFIRG